MKRLLLLVVIASTINARTVTEITDLVTRGQHQQALQAIGEIKSVDERKQILQSIINQAPLTPNLIADIKDTALKNLPEKSAGEIRRAVTQAAAQPGRIVTQPSTVVPPAPPLEQPTKPVTSIPTAPPLTPAAPIQKTVPTAPPLTPAAPVITPAPVVPTSPEPRSRQTITAEEFAAQREKLKKPEPKPENPTAGDLGQYGKITPEQQQKIKQAAESRARKEKARAGIGEEFTEEEWK